MRLSTSFDEKLYQGWVRDGIEAVSECFFRQILSVRHTNMLVALTKRNVIHEKVN